VLREISARSPFGVLQVKVPMGRYANAEDVASMVTHLCSDEASFLNGGVYPVDGGVTA
jgi:NAD(P)-dependent dehydrogenase (short-subunit alcohol dehydrogenase family)